MITNRSKPPSPRKAGPPRAGQAQAASPFWNCRLTRFEPWLLVGVIGCAVLLHLGPVLHSALGVPLLYLLAIASYLSPTTGFLFIACGQFLPFPETSLNNPAQIGVLVWLPMALLRYQRVRLEGVWRLWPILPFLIWFMVLTGEAVFWPASDYMKALFYCVIACQLANEAEGKYLKCLFGLCLGALLVMVAYWAQEAGLPIEISDWGGSREGFTRMGGVRADSVMVWPALLMGISGLLGIQVAFASKAAPCSSPKWLTQLTLVLTVASLPPLVSTMCHGAFAGLALVLCALIGSVWYVARDGAMGNPRFRQLIHWCCAGVVVAALLFAFDAFQMRTKTLALDKFHREQSLEMGGVAASRTGVWHDAINTIMSYPLFGIRVTGDQEVITSEYASQGGYMAHNVFLDYGRYVGIPGMLLLAFFFFRPVFQMYKSGRLAQYLPFILAHFAMFIFWMSLSFQFYKTFWALWMLMTIAISHSPKVSRQGNAPAPARQPRTNIIFSGVRRPQPGGGHPAGLTPRILKRAGNNFPPA
jgi:hypothetical protein